MRRGRLEHCHKIKVLCFISRLVQVGPIHLSKSKQSAGPHGTLSTSCVEEKHDEAKDTHPPKKQSDGPKQPSTLAEVRRLPARATAPRAGRGCDAFLTSGGRRAGGVQIIHARHAGGVQVIHGYHANDPRAGRGYDALLTSEARHAGGVQVIHVDHELST
eukprot:scaffold115189_cov84-Phaeocystis_antarctica.AAC.2